MTVPNTVPHAVPYTPLDEAREFIARYVCATGPQLDVMALWAAHTHAMGAFVITPRLLFTSKDPASGKTVAMTVVKDLSHEPFEASGATTYAIKAKMAEAMGDLTFAYDEISDLFGRAGLNKSSHPIANVLRRGYKRGAVDSWSVGRVAEEINIFIPFVMTGLRTAVPADIGTRCVHIPMVSGDPLDYYDARGAEFMARVMNMSLRNYVQRNVRAIADFRARGLHPKLTGRRLEIWEPLLAVASALGGKVWLSRALSAFSELALSTSDVPVLTPQQTALRAMVDACEAIQERSATKVLQVYGADLRDELRRFNEPLFDSMTDRQLAMLMADAVGISSDVITQGKRQGRGWKVAAIQRAWERRKPAELAAFESPEEPDPFEV